MKKGLYNGETADDIAKRKGLRYREDILDNMGSTELSANIFRISQTEEKLRKDNVQTEKDACKTHNKIGKIVRKAIKEAILDGCDTFPKIRERTSAGTGACGGKGCGPRVVKLLKEHQEGQW